MARILSKEIGSEFWNSEPFKGDNLFLLSGETALEFIICDIVKNHYIKQALLPSYCCHTMIEPFIRHNIPVEFYEIYYCRDGLYACVPQIQEGTIFYYMTYFGFTNLPGIDIGQIRSSVEVIVEDQTHSWLTGHCLQEADYRFASYRKWTGFDGIASATKCHGLFDIMPSLVNEKFCSMRRKAQEMKRDYIEYGIGKKQEYINLFAEAEELLENDYVGYIAKDDTIANLIQFDKEKVKLARRRNAEIVIDGLKDIHGVHSLFPKIEADDVPLFVPIILVKNRDKLKNYLISKSIYCPVHWPVSGLHNGISNRAKLIYEQELSIICDQRYDENDMKRIIDVISSMDQLIIG